MNPAVDREIGADLTVEPGVSITTDDRRASMPSPVVHFEIRAPDPDATRKFFGQLFGRTFPDGGMLGHTYVDNGVEDAVPGLITALPRADPLLTFCVVVQDEAAA